MGVRVAGVPLTVGVAVGVRVGVAVSVGVLVVSPSTTSRLQFCTVTGRDLPLGSESTTSEKRKLTNPAA